MEKSVISTFKNAVSAGDLEQCKKILVDYSDYESTLIASIDISEILLLKNLTTHSYEEDGVGGPLLPETAEYAYVKGEKYPTRLKKIPADPSFIVCFNLINELREKHGFIGMELCSEELKQRPSDYSPHVADFDMADYLKVFPEKPKKPDFSMIYSLSSAFFHDQSTAAATTQKKHEEDYGFLPGFLKGKSF